MREIDWKSREQWIEDKYISNRDRFSNYTANQTEEDKRKQWEEVRRIMELNMVLYGKW